MKYRKPVSVILIAAFVELTTSCTSLRRLSPDRVTPRANEYRIVRILKKDGGRIEVDRSNPARIAGDGIHISGQLKVPLAGTTFTKRDDFYVVETENGLMCETNAYRTKGDFCVFEPISDIVIPLSEVSRFWIVEKSAAKTILGLVWVAGVIIGGLVVLHMMGDLMGEVELPINWDDR